MAQYYLGFDAGGTQCRSRLVDAQGKVLGRGDGGPANARIGLEAVRSVLLETGAKAIRMAGISEADLPEIAAFPAPACASGWKRSTSLMARSPSRPTG